MKMEEVKFCRFLRIDICVLLFAAIAVSNKGVFTKLLNPTPVAKNRECAIRDCEKVFKHGDMVTTFTTENLSKNYIDAKMMAKCDNKTVDICTVAFWKSNRNETCKLLVNSTSGHVSVTVNNGKKYESCIKVMFEFHRTVRCVQGSSDHNEMVEVVDGGEVATEKSSPSPADSRHTNSSPTDSSPTDSSSTDSSYTKIQGGAVKGSTYILPTTPEDKTTKNQSCGAAKSTLCTSLMAALIFGSLYLLK